MLKQSISQEELHEAHAYLKLFTAQASVLYGKQYMVMPCRDHNYKLIITFIIIIILRNISAVCYALVTISNSYNEKLMNSNCFLTGKRFQTFNVHQLLHLPEVVKDLGPLWSNSCFPFEDYNGDLRELFHGTKNVDGQVCS